VQVDGAWIDKGYLVQKAAEQTGHSLQWHKLVCRVPPGVATFGKPSYHHMLCFSKVTQCSTVFYEFATRSVASMHCLICSMLLPANMIAVTRQV
jgi:hypothetical protein